MFSQNQSKLAGAASSVLTRAVIIVVCSLWSITACFAGEFHVLYYPAATEETRVIRDSLQSDPEIDALLGFVDRNLLGDAELRILFGVGDGPLYDPVSRTVQIPYEFVTEVDTLMDQVKYAEEADSRLKSVSDVLIHTLLHEIGHAVVDVHNIPIVGREEDSVDSFATILLLHHIADGADIAISAADFFAIEDWHHQDESLAQFWGDHSLDIQRANQILCHVYGSDPDRFSELLDEPGVDDDTRELCIESYEQVSHGWSTLLESAGLGALQ
ncbi:MAG: DUF4344 domain-containing metallopeptidase [Pseudomonadota bacterium]